jgi:hypothetical protein
MSDDERDRLRRINADWNRLHDPRPPRWLYDPTFVLAGLLIVIALALAGYLLKLLGFIR